MNNLKEATDFSDGELKLIYETDKSTAQKLRSIYLATFQGFESEINRISLILSDFTQRTSVSMTVSGLISFLPSLIGSNNEYLNHFLIWTFPFLLIAIVCFYFSSTRITSIPTQIPVYPPDTYLELVVLKNKVIAFQNIWKKNYDLYNKVLEWYRATSSFTYSYIISFSVNFYLFTFIGRPEICNSILILLSVLILSTCIFFRGKLQSTKSINYGEGVGI
jgi:hypothetical protein